MIYTLFILYFEVFQNMHGQKMKKMIFDIFYFILFYFTAYSFENGLIIFLSKFFIVVFVIFETISWFATNNGICAQVMLAILDFTYIRHMKTLFFIRATVVLTITTIICLIPARVWPFRFYKIKKSHFLFQFFFMIYTYHFYVILMNGIYPYRTDFYTKPDNYRVFNYFQYKDVTVQPPKSKLKNFIMIHIECTELRSLGMYNTEYPSSMPFLQSLVDKGTLFTNVNQQSDHGFTLGSVFVQQSGLPILDSTYKSIGNLFLSRKVHTITDFLHKLGYKCLASCTKLCTPYRFYNLHHVHSIDHKTHKGMSDLTHFNYVINKLLPKLSKEKSPFSLFILNEDTHPPFDVQDECLDALPDKVKKNWPKPLISLQCLDRYLKRLFDKIHELRLDENSVIYIYGDHLLWGGPKYYHMPRKMLVLLPFRTNIKINKSITLYDVAPSVLSLLGINDYRPKFPFGFDFFSPNTTALPTHNDRQYIYNLAHYS